jgi:ribosomal protein S18 acetylase RimI-like enzyme
MNCDMQIREAVPGDMDSIVELIRQSREWQESVGQPAAFKTDRRRETSKGIAEHTCYVAVRNGSIVGSFSLEFSDSSTWTNYQGSARYLHRLVTSVAYHRMGIGSCMLDKAEAMASETADVLRLDVVEQNKTLRNWYERRGYVCMGRVMLPHWTNASALYEKVLNQPVEDRSPLSHNC